MEFVLLLLLRELNHCLRKHCISCKIDNKFEETSELFWLPEQKIVNISTCLASVVGWVFLFALATISVTFDEKVKLLNKVL